MNLYLISGLGADERVFKNLQLSKQYKIIYLKWIVFKKNESILQYANRLSSRIDKSTPFAVIGLSLGGMIASEMAELLPSHKTVLISSAACAKQLPFYLHWLGKLSMYRFVPSSVFKWCNRYVYWLFGIHTKEEKKLYHEMIKNTDIVFIKNAVNAIANWEKKNMPPNAFHIHGGSDHLLPVRFIKPDAVIKGGGHLMILNRAGEISELINKYLSQ